MPAIIPITNAVFSADSDDIRSRFLEKGGRDDDHGGIGCGGSMYSVVVVVVDEVVEDVVIIPNVVLNVVVVDNCVVEVVPLVVVFVEVVSGIREELMSVSVVLILVDTSFEVVLPVVEPEMFLFYLKYS